MKRTMQLLLVLLGLIIGIVLIVDFKSLNSHEEVLQDAADNAALTIAMELKNSEDLVETFTSLVSELGHELIQEEIRLEAQWIETKSMVKATASRPFKGMILRKKSSSMEAFVDANP